MGHASRHGKAGAGLQIRVERSGGSGGADERPGSEGLGA
jgi:hypothetical protein